MIFVGCIVQNKSFPTPNVDYFEDAISLMHWMNLMANAFYCFWSPKATRLQPTKFNQNPYEKFFVVCLSCSSKLKIEQIFLFFLSYS